MSNRFITQIHKKVANKHKDKLTVVILAASMGYRMKSYGPKCLLKDKNNNTILDVQISTIQSVYPNAEIIVSIGFESDKVIKHVSSEVKIIENQLYEKTNVLEEVRLCLNNILNGHIIFIPDDILFNTHTINRIIRHGSSIVVDLYEQLPKTEVGVTIVENYATIFSYDIDIKWGQIVHLTGNELIAFKNICSDRTKGRLYIHEVLNILLNKKHILNSVHSHKMKISKVTR